jgi:hypothetical protein
MPNYKVVSENVTGKKPGDSISEQELEGCNIPALLEAGHIVGENQSTKAEKE